MPKTTRQALKLNRVIRKELDFVQDKVSQDGDAAMKALTHVEELLKKYADVAHLFSRP